MTETQFVQQYTDPVAQITAMQAIVTALDGLMATSIGAGGILQYKLDDGQVVINTQYNNYADILRARLYYNQEIQRLIAQVNGRNTVLKDCGTYLRGGSSC